MKNLLTAVLLIVAATAYAGDKLVIKELPNQSDGIQIATATTEKVSFHGSTPVAQRSGSDQAAVTATSTDGTAAAAADLAELKTESEKIGDDVRATIVLVNELRAALVQKGLIKGSD